MGPIVRLYLQGNDDILPLPLQKMITKTISLFYLINVLRIAQDRLIIWLPDTNILISRKLVTMRNPVSECVTKKWMKKMKGLEQSIFFYFIENPHTHSFLDEQHSPMRPREEFSDLIERLKVLVQENEIALTFKDIDMKDRNGF